MRAMSPRHLELAAVKRENRALRETIAELRAQLESYADAERDRRRLAQYAAEVDRLHGELRSLRTRLTSTQTMAMTISAEAMRVRLGYPVDHAAGGAL